MPATHLVIRFSFSRVRCLFLAFFGLFLTFSTLSASAQSRVDQLSDEQVQEFYRRAQTSGLSEPQIEQAAMSQGYTLDDITKMRRRIKPNAAGGAITIGVGGGTIGGGATVSFLQELIIRVIASAANTIRIEGMLKVLV